MPWIIGLATNPMGLMSPHGQCRASDHVNVVELRENKVGLELVDQVAHTSDSGEEVPRTSFLNHVDRYVARWLIAKYRAPETGVGLEALAREVAQDHGELPLCATSGEVGDHHQQANA
jgi:hypothetical protein